MFMLLKYIPATRVVTVRVGRISRRRPNDIDVKNLIAAWIDLIILVGPLSLDVYNWDEGKNLDSYS